MKSKLRILFIVGCLGNGGAEKQLMFLLRHLPKNYQARLFNHSRESHEYWEGEVQDMDIIYDSLASNHSQLRRFYQVGKLITTWQPDLVICWNVYSGLYVLPYRWLNKKVKLALSFRNDAHYLLKTQPLMSFLIRHCDLIISNTHAAIQQLKEMGLQLPLSQVLPNAIGGVEQPVVIQEKVNRIGFCGNIHPRKGVDVFLRAIQLLDKKGVQADFIVAGQGPCEIYVDLAHSLGISHLVDFQNDVMCATQVKSYDIFVLPSQHEGCPNVLLEAMVAGIPSIVTEVGGIPEIVNGNENALMIKADDPLALANAIEKLTDSYSLRLELSTNSLKSMHNRSPWLISQEKFPLIVESVLK